MLSRRILSTIPLLRYYSPTWCILQRTLCKKKNERLGDHEEKSNPTLGDIGSKYQLFRDLDSEVIMDVNEERQKYASLLQSEEQVEINQFEGLNLNRGVTGVFDIDDLVMVLERENAENVFVAHVPAKYKYADYICAVSGKSQRHMLAVAQFVRRVFKHKRNSQDEIPKLEGRNSKDWVALDLGNIVLHIFSREARLLYDIDSLWSVGAEYDKECRKQDPIVEMLEKHSIYLSDLQPAS